MTIVNFIFSVILQVVLFVETAVEKVMTMPEGEREMIFSTTFLAVSITAMAIGLIIKYIINRHNLYDPQIENQMNLVSQERIHISSLNINSNDKPRLFLTPSEFMPTDDDVEVLIDSGLYYSSVEEIIEPEQPKLIIDEKPDKIKNEILKKIVVGHQNFKDDVVRLLRKLSYIEDTSEFLEENPQVLQFVFS